MKPNILFIILDSLRADKFFGNKKTSVTPNLDLLIKQSTYFEKTISTADSTLLAITSIFTSLYPFKTGIRSDRFNKLDKNIVTYFKILKDSGYHLYTHQPTVTKTIGLMPEFENSDSTYDYHFDLDSGLGEKILQTLKNITKEPWFYYIHANDLHFPINPPSNFHDDKFGESNYEKMVSSIDGWIGKIMAEVNLENTIVILTADHGVFIQSVMTDMGIISFEPDAEKQLRTTRIAKKIPGFLNPVKKKIFTKMEEMKKGEKIAKIEKMNLKPHQKRALLWQRGDVDKVLLDENVHVPLLIMGLSTPKNKIISQQVRHVDIFPTIAEIIGVDFKIDTDGVSVLPLIKGESMKEVPAYMESTPFIQKKANEVIGIRTSDFKYFRDREDSKKRIHLFDLKNDPLEENNIAKKEVNTVLEMEGILSNLIQNKSKDSTEFSEEETKLIEEELKKLGYD